METTETTTVSQKDATVSWPDSLRRFADFLDEHPELTSDEGIGDYLNIAVSMWPAASSFSPERAARLLMPCNKTYSDSYLELSRYFGRLRFEFDYPRSSVCTRRVVNTVHHPATIREAWIEEIVEWDCRPLLTEGENDESQR